MNMTIAEDANLTMIKNSMTVREDVLLFVYSQDFDSLWARATDDKSEFLPRNVFLVWDSVPRHEKSDDVGVSKYLTAYDWVMAMALAAHKACSSDEAMERFNFRLSILPLPSVHSDTDSLAMKITPLLVKSILPWVTLHEQIDQINFIKSFETNSESLPPTLAETFKVPSLRGEDCANFIAQLWRTDLTKAGVRHSVSNAIGPAALGQTLVNDGFLGAESVLRDWVDGEDSLRLTFWKFLELLDLLPPLKLAADGGRAKSTLGGLADEPFVKEDLFGQFKRLNFALVDDQATAGFHECLSAFLLGSNLKSAEAEGGVRSKPEAVSSSKNGRFTLSSFSHPQVLLSWLQHTIKNTGLDKCYRPVFGRRNRYAGEAAPSILLPEFDILFLDDILN